MEARGEMAKERNVGKRGVRREQRGYEKRQ